MTSQNWITFHSLVVVKSLSSFDFLYPIWFHLKASPLHQVYMHDTRAGEACFHLPLTLVTKWETFLKINTRQGDINWRTKVSWSCTSNGVGEQSLYISHLTLRKTVFLVCFFSQYWYFYDVRYYIFNEIVFSFAAFELRLVQRQHLCQHLEFCYIA